MDNFVSFLFFNRMVNVPSNVELIRWSDSGDYFFGTYRLPLNLTMNRLSTIPITVLDHERFAHEVLGRWFNHRNFQLLCTLTQHVRFPQDSSPTQGVLKSDTETEFWNFAHANFHRGQPDLLCLIQRKKPLPQSGEEASIDLPGGITFGGCTSCCWNCCRDYF
jgi:heat shock transcription factor, other eukaryote